MGRKDALGEMKNGAVRLFQSNANGHGGFGSERAAGERGRPEVRLQGRAQQRRPEHQTICPHACIEPSFLAGRKQPLLQLAKSSRKYFCESVRTLVYGLVALGTLVKGPASTGADWRAKAELGQVNITAPAVS